MFEYLQKVKIYPNRLYCCTFTKNGKDLKPFDAIPGPKSYPLIGTLFKYLPLIGEYTFDRFHHNGFKKLQHFGPVIREEIIPGIFVVWLFKPEDFEMLYRCEGRYPERRSHLALQKYRLDKPQVYKSGGLLPTNGQEWWRLRKSFQKELSKVQSVRQYLKDSDKIIKDFLVQRVHSEQTVDFLPELSRLFLELTCLVAFDEQLDSFNPSELNSNSRSSKLIESAANMNSCILRTDHGPQLWKWFDTPMYKKLKSAHFFIDQVAVQFVQKKIQNLQEKRNGGSSYSLLELYLTCEELDVKDVVGMAADMLLAGIDTMSYTSGFGLYHLATNPNKQQNMRNELLRLLTVEEPVTEYHINNCVYTKAVLKEIYRMNPISIGIGRILPSETVFSGYRVPAGTVTVTQNQVSCRLPEYFANPNSFLPERWIKGHPDFHPCHPYLVLPFGHGPRTCIARRLAEQNLLLLLINVIRKYRITWDGEVLDSKSLLINKPDKPVKINFIPY